MARSIVKEIVLEEKKPPWQVIMSNAETKMSSRRWLSLHCILLKIQKWLVWSCENS